MKAASCPTSALDQKDRNPDRGHLPAVILLELEVRNAN